MKPELKTQLIDKYPTLFVQTKVQRSSMRFGICTGDGWNDIIDHACSKLVNYPVEFSQIKEKFGELRMYLTYLQRDMPESSYSELEAIISEAATKSRNTCDVCGSPGKIRPNSRGWLACRCDEHIE